MRFGLFMMPLPPPARSFVDSYEQLLASIDAKRKSLVAAR